MMGLGKPVTGLNMAIFGINSLDFWGVSPSHLLRMHGGIFFSRLCSLWFGRLAYPAAGTPQEGATWFRGWWYPFGLPCC